MANKRISELPLAEFLLPDDEFLLARSGKNYKVTRDQLVAGLSGGGGGGNAVTRKITLDYRHSAFRYSLPVVRIPIMDVPPMAKIFGLTIKHSVSWLGSGVAFVSCSVGCDGDVPDDEFYSSPHDITGVPSAKNFRDVAQYQSLTFDEHSMIAVFNTNAAFGTGHLTLLNGGSVDFWISYVQLT